jgi:eukaryotic-like serine/threonine-protein kinase
MNASDSQRIQELFHQAAELPTGERSDFLAAACAEDDAVREDVLRLLKADEAAAESDAWQRPAIDHEARAQNAADLIIGEIVGPYRLIELIGSGGMGKVYRAVRVDAQYDKAVAVKLIRAGFDAGTIAARFRTERQILANLEHPCIARLLDGGVTADGSPYLIMEYVQGESPGEYCKRHEITLRPRLDLFRQICGAVHYAHQRMVVHRDLKPGNILVTAEGVPKLLDFGIAKMLSAEPDQDSPPTEPGLRMMTLRYASPEQVNGESITTASDIYSLGVILYELLTERSPYRNPRAPTLEAMRAVSEENPPRPSIYARELTGDLDNIVLKALKKNPAERYGSADQFADDIELYLTGRPVLAHGDSISYVAAKFIRRHKAAAAAAVLAVAMLVAGLVMVNQARARAEARFNDVRELAHSVLYDYHDAIERLPGSTPVRAMLVKDASRYLEKLSAQADTPDLKREIVESYVRLSKVQGDTYGSNLGDTAGAVRSADKAVAVAEELLSSDSSNKSLVAAADAFSVRASLLFSSGKLEETAKLYERAIGLRRKVAASAPDDVDNGIALTSLLKHLGDLYGGFGLQNLGKTQQAMELYQEADAVIGPLAARFPGHADIAQERFTVLLSLSTQEMAQGHVDQARSHLEQAVAEAGKIVQSSPEDSDARFELANAEARLGMSLLDARRGAEAVPHMKNSADAMSALLKADPSNALYKRSLAVAETQLAAALRAAGNLDAALEQNRNALALATALSKVDAANSDYQADVGIDERKLADTLLARGEAPQAVGAAKDAESVLCTHAGPGSTYLTANCDRALATEGNAQLALGRAAQASEALAKAETLAAANLAKDSTNAIYRSDLARAQSALALALARWDRAAEAQAAHERATQNWAALRTAGALTAEDSWRAAEADRLFSVASSTSQHR